jgi:acetyltransferase-like isoleucine patch superfamily enzyme
MRSLNQFLSIRSAIIRLKILIWNRFWGMDVHPTAKISLSARLDKTNPTGVHIGAYTTVTFGVAILAHDMCRKKRVDTFIGDCCFIGAHSVILPGVRIGDHCIIAAGSIVSKDVPPHSIAAGNPASIIRSGIETTKYGVLTEEFR